jgi:L-glyceraldehyde 3-phosphate reductase
MTWTPDPNRYDAMTFRRCGRSGIDLPAISLGLWHNFGEVDRFDTCRAMIRRGFDLGITHFDLANNYGPPPGSAEETFGRIIEKDLAAHRDELVISSKAGWRMWPGPYGDLGSRKYLVASLDQSLARMGLEYVDIFYHHRPDPDTPLEETMGALDYIVRSGRALYVGVSSYRGERMTEAVKILRELGTPCLIHQPNYNILDRWIERDLIPVLRREGVGSIVFCPLAQGLLTDKYLEGIPDDSRAAKPHGFLKKERITPEMVETLRRLNDLAKARNQSLAQMAIAWTLRLPEVTSSLIGASRVEQIEENVAALDNLDFTDEELTAIDEIVAEG